MKNITPFQSPAINNRRRGVAALEFAVMLPLLILIFSGLYEVGYLLAAAQTVSNASAAAATLAIEEDSTNAEVERLARNVAAAELEIDPSLITVNLLVVGDSAPIMGTLPTNPAADITQLQSGDILQVEIRVPCDELVPVSLVRFTSGSSLRGMTAMAMP